MSAVAAWSVDRFVADSRVLDAASQTRAAAGDAVGAVVCAWGADLSMAKAVVWEHAAAETTPSWRTLLTWAGSVVPLGAAEASELPTPSAADAVTATRVRLASRCEPALQRELAEAWPPVDHLVDLPVPTDDQVAAAVEARLGGSSPADFVIARRARARALLDSARDKRVSGDATAAIQDVYEADLAAVEAYLVESAQAAGDGRLLSMITRWELVSHAIASIPSLPSSVVEAVTRLRTAMANALGPADGQRLREAFPPL